MEIDLSLFLCSKWRAVADYYCFFYYSAAVFSLSPRFMSCDCLPALITVSSVTKCALLVIKLKISTDPTLQFPSWGKTASCAKTFSLIRFIGLMRRVLIIKKDRIRSMHYLE